MTVNFGASHEPTQTSVPPRLSLITHSGFGQKLQIDSNTHSSLFVISTDQIFPSNKGKMGRPNLKETCQSEEKKTGRSVSSAIARD